MRKMQLVLLTPLRGGPGAVGVCFCLRIQEEVSVMIVIGTRLKRFFWAALIVVSGVCLWVLMRDESGGVPRSSGIHGERGDAGTAPGFTSLVERSEIDHKSYGRARIITRRNDAIVVGAPLTIAEIVEGKSAEGEATPVRVLSNSSGVVERALAVGKYVVSSRHGPDVSIVVKAGDVLDLDYQLTREANLEGRVVDGTGTGLSGAIIEDRLMSAEGRAEGVWREAVISGADGKFTIDDKSAPIDLRARVRGFAAGPTVEVRSAVRDAAGDVGRNIVLTVAGYDASVTGRVITRSGLPVASARVAVGAGIRVNAPIGKTRGGGPIAIETTDKDGRFSVEGVAVGNAAVAGTEEGRAPYIGMLRLDVGRNVDIEIVLPTGARVRGVVADSQGNAVGGALVTMQRRRIGLSELRFDLRAQLKEWDLPHTVSAADGSFEVGGVPPGDVWVCAFLWNKGEDRASLLGRAEERKEIGEGDVVVWNPVLERTSKIVVRVVEADGSVRTRTESVGAVPMQGGRPANVTVGLARTDEKGYVYEIAPCRVVPHTLTMPCRDAAGNTTWVTRRNAMPGEEVINLQFPAIVESAKPVIIVGQMRTDGSEVEFARGGWRLRVTSRIGMVPAVLNGTGGFRAVVAGPGRYQLYVQRKGAVRAVSNWVEVPQVKVWDFGEFIVGPGGVAEIECTQATTDAKMSVSIGGGFGERILNLVRPGVFSCRDVQPGTYRVNLASDTWRIGEVSIDVLPNKVAHVLLKPEPARLRSLLIWMPEPMSWTVARIWVQDQGGERILDLGTRYSSDLRWTPVGLRRGAPIAPASLVVEIDGGTRSEWKLDWESAETGKTRTISLR